MALVGVIVPVYNRLSPALRAVESVLQQTWKDYEVIVVDDGSTCDLAPLEERVAAACGKFIRVTHGGPSAARNAGARAAASCYLAFLDSDDEWLPLKLEKQVAFMLERACRICQTEEIWIRRGMFVNQKKTHEKPDGEAFYKSLQLCCISPSSVMLEHELFDSFGGFDEEMMVCEDYELWLRMTVSEQVPLLREALIRKYGGHADQLSRSEPAMDRFRVYALVKLLAGPSLSEEKVRAVLETIAGKSAVLSAGAAKRGNQASAELYALVQAEASGVNSVATRREKLALLLLRLRAELFQQYASGAQHVVP